MLKVILPNISLYNFPHHWKSLLTGDITSVLHEPQGNVNHKIFETLKFSEIQINGIYFVNLIFLNLKNGRILKNKTG